MGEDLPHWIDYYAELLGCDRSAAAVAVAIDSLLSERDRQRLAIGRLRGRNAVLERTLGTRTAEGASQTSEVALRPAIP